MIDEMHVSNLALIKDVSIAPSAGLTVLTGETGAGKTALLSSARLLMGARADRELVREGAEEATVEGRFFNKGVESGEIVAVRRVTKDGRSRVSINGVMASVGELANDIAPMIDLCSQHDSHVLMKPATHAVLLDAWGGLTELTQAYVQVFSECEGKRRELERLLEGTQASEEQLEHARFVLRQIEAVSPDAQEYSDLRAALSKIEHSEALVRATTEASDMLNGEDGALEDANLALGALEEGGRFDSKLADFAETVREAVFVLEDAARDIASYRASIDFEADEMSRMQDRVAAYQGLLRNYGPEIEDVLKAAEDAREKIGAADDSEHMVDVAKAELDAAEQRLSVVAAALLEARREASSEFADKVTSVMHTLEMGTAQLTCEVLPLARDQWTKSGPCTVTFEFRPAENMQARPLARIASGGELSRVMLALHVVMENSDKVQTLIFDEIDAGVGGATAVALADVLVKLAKTHQVIIVTHLAQVAARADKHYLVRKVESGGIAETELVCVSGTEREREIARMLSGRSTEASIAHARELLETADASR